MIKWGRSLPGCGGLRSPDDPVLETGMQQKQSKPRTTRMPVGQVVALILVLLGEDVNP